MDVAHHLGTREELIRDFQYWNVKHWRWTKKDKFICCLLWRKHWTALFSFCSKSFHLSSPWSTVSTPCNASCGGGVETKVRSCTNPRPQVGTIVGMIDFCFTVMVNKLCDEEKIQHLIASFSNYGLLKLAEECVADKFRQSWLCR